MTPETQIEILKEALKTILKLGECNFSTEKELGSIDSALPIAYWDGKDKAMQVNTWNHVVNYNKGWGVVENMLEIAKERNIKIDL